MSFGENLDDGVYKECLIHGWHVYDQQPMGLTWPHNSVVWLHEDTHRQRHIDL